MCVISHSLLSLSNFFFLTASISSSKSLPRMLKWLLNNIFSILNLGLFRPLRGISFKNVLFNDGNINIVSTSLSRKLLVVLSSFNITNPLVNKDPLSHQSLFLTEIGVTNSFNTSNKYLPQSLLV